jgi:DNA-binding transcriptional MerR regulator
MRTPSRRRRPSTIDRLDPEIRDLIGKLRIDKGYTIDEIRDQLEKMLAEELLPSRSALGRHVKSLEEIGAQLRQSREVANALVAQVGDAPEDRVADLNIELMHSVILRLVTATNDDGDGAPVTFGAEDVMFLTRSLQALAGARKTNADMILKTREAAKKEAAAAVDAIAKESPAAAGLTAETVDVIKRRIMGIAA